MACRDCCSLEVIRGQKILCQDSYSTQRSMGSTFDLLMSGDWPWFTTREKWIVWASGGASQFIIIEILLVTITSSCLRPIVDQTHFFLAVPPPPARCLTHQLTCETHSDHSRVGFTAQIISAILPPLLQTFRSTSTLLMLIYSSLVSNSCFQPPALIFISSLC